jgi:pimeloyl-ACP methyl ester carboxylesterase
MEKGRRLILFPGLAADERMYQEVTEKGADLPVRLVTPRLLVPHKGETMPAYARRHAEWLLISEDDIVGGCSFGSMVAAEIARQQCCHALVSLSGCVSSDALVHHSERLRMVAGVLPYWLVRYFLTRTFFLTAVFGQAQPGEIALGRQMIKDAPEQLVRRGGELASQYVSTQPIKCRHYMLHGALDRVIRCPQGAHVTIVEDAGHGMVVSHPEQVVMFFGDVCQQM